MPRQEIYHIHPTGWENDDEEERFKFSTLDYMWARIYCSYALFFRLDDINNYNVVEVLKEGLERMLSQVRHLCGTIEKDSTGGHSFVKRRDSTVQFIVQHLGADKEYPSLDEIEKTNFTSVSLGDLHDWSVSLMTYEEKPEAHLDCSPTVSAFKASFVRGGLVFNMHHHHSANDVMGWAGYTHQLAEHCKTILNNTSPPPWNPALLDRSRLLKPEPPEEKKVNGPPLSEAHPAHVESVSLLFHPPPPPKSKAAELKRLASPTDGT
ncbi:uncharacterized protein KD926_002227 [Aspergillus affinis]|uniref:uncharacterized protein n=1 Tax=Aspergillus affinis TaxID=1070780 RepID=UPI0022FF31E0|nr:uncharacterized protein KD926_002227 [Aspergillus affinis]KAI9036197.1 hypothetical protein KD926_002227 [Aspergillus affinis]